MAAPPLTPPSQEHHDHLAAHEEFKLVPTQPSQFPGAFGTGQQEQHQHVEINPAHFPGSFVPAYRTDSRKPPARRDPKTRFLHYCTDGWRDVEIWRSAFIETVGTTMQCYLSATIHIVIVNLQTQQIAPFVGISNILVISLFIYAVAPASGGHLNPMITFATMVTGLTGFVRGMLYMIGQTLGAAVAGGLIRGSFGEGGTALYQGGGCLLDTSQIYVGQAFLIETILCFTTIFLAFGVGLDPRQAKLFGPRMGPLLVGCVIGLTSFGAIGLGSGYPGAGLNPARCFSTAVARGTFINQWVWWIGALSGGVLQGLTYHIAPPYHREQKKERPNLP